METGSTSHTGRSSLNDLTWPPSASAVTEPVSPTALTSVLPASEDGSFSDNPAEHELPQSRTESYQSRSSGWSNRAADAPESISSPLSPFAHKIRQLKEVLPHLKNIQHRSRQAKAKVDCYDFSQGSVVEVRHAQFHRGLDDFYVDFDVDHQQSLAQALQEAPSSEVDLRLIVAEDVSSELIELLGSHYGISPEFFEEHLLNAGWKNGSDINEEADTWISRDMNKDYVSIKWYRPVQRRFQKPRTRQDRIALLDPKLGKTGLTWTEEASIRSKSKKIQHNTRPNSNVLRLDWDIHRGIIVNKSQPRTIALEERASLWSNQQSSCQIVLVLLDPLPTVYDETTGTVAALEALGLYDPKEDSLSVLDAAESGEVAGAPDPDALEKSSGSRGFWAKARSEKQPFLPFALKYVIDIVRTNLKKPQNDHHHNSTDPEAAQAESATVPGQDTDRGSLERRSSMGQADVAMPTAQSGTDVPETSAAVRRGQRTIRRVRPIFQGLLPRGPPIDYSEMMGIKDLINIERYLNTETSTSRDLASWIRYQIDAKSGLPAHSGPLDFLFALVQKDTLNTLRLMDLALTQIGKDILDDSLIQQRLMNWRMLLERFDAELRALESALHKFAKFIGSLTSWKSIEQVNASQTSPLVDGLLQKGVTEIVIMRRRAASSYQSLMANMSIVESKRGIVEAEGVAKLTELAFFFIPLTFSASIFSMQVKELNAADISISTFIILAIVITLLSYALRLFIRSQSFTQNRRSWIQEIRSDANISPGNPIPSTDFLLWLWRRLGFLVTLVIVDLALIVSSIAALWFTDINRGFKAILTILLLILTLGASYFLIGGVVYTDERGLHIRQHIFKGGPKGYRREPIRFTKESFSWVLSWWTFTVVAATAIAIGSLVPIWSQSLVSGIRVGVTVAIGLFYVIFLVFAILKGIRHGRFNQENKHKEPQD